MNINHDVIEGKWKEIKGDILKTWGNLTDDEVDKSKGDLMSLQGVIQKKYGQTKEHVESAFDTIVSKYKSDTAAVKARTEVDDTKLNS